MVSRETILDSGLTEIGFPANTRNTAVPRLVRFADLLVDEAIPKGFLGPNEADRLVQRHILASAVLARFVPSRGTIVDVGSGAGLPAVVLACLDAGEVIAIESQGRRASFIRRVAGEIGLLFHVEHGRAEELGKSRLRESGVAAFGRALAAPEVALELVVPFVAMGGTAVVSTPAPSARTEPTGSGLRSTGDGPLAGYDGPLEAHDSVQIVGEELGLGPLAASRFAIPGLSEALWVLAAEKLRPTPSRYPRRAGVPQRRPLGH